ncbi:hypothetical protein PAMP_017090 [Pampus punctatissimus]
MSPIELDFDPNQTHPGVKMHHTTLKWLVIGLSALLTRANLPKSSMLAGNRSNTESRTGSPLSVTAGLKPPIQRSIAKSAITDILVEVLKFPFCTAIFTHTHRLTHRYNQLPPGVSSSPQSSPLPAHRPQHTGTGAI